MAALIALAWPMRSVPAHAEAAYDALRAASTALSDGDLRTARTQVSVAEDEVAAARSGVDGVGGSVWGHVPVASGAVADARHLLDALDEAVGVARLGVRTYPIAAGKNATLMQGQEVDLGQLSQVLTNVEEMSAGIDAAVVSLEQVDGTTPVVGERIAERRDAALDVAGPLADTLHRVSPLLDQLPVMLGASGDRRYLVVFTNPSELRYSGGAALSYAEMQAVDGRLEIGDAEGISKLGDNVANVWWPKVRGNVFHKRGKSSMQNATFNPNWSISGEELLRAYRQVSGIRADGLLVIDVQAIARLLAVTGPVEGTPYGTLSADNLVSVLVGSYDTYTDVEARQALNEQLTPIFRDRLFGSGDVVSKGRALGDAARAREFAIYDRNSAVQAALTDLGLDGDLSTTAHDYVGVFSQNTNISKVDYYQRRDVSSVVRLRADGSAKVRLTIDVHNDTPPYAGEEPDPRKGSYQTRWAGMSLAAFLPKGAEARSLAVEGEQVEDPHVAQTLDRPFVRQPLTLAPGATGRMVVEYVVPAVAEVSSGSLAYRLDVDPQGIVQSATLRMRVTPPSGFSVGALPEGWVADGRSAVLKGWDFEESHGWALSFTS